MPEDPRPALPKTIRTERLLLRPYRLSDAEEILEYALDPAWIEHLPLPRPYLPEHASEFVASKILEDRSVAASWAAVHEGRVVGGARLGFVPPHRKAELGYGFAPRVWGKGLATEAARAVIGAAFSADPLLARIEAYTSVENPASEKVLRKLGMKHEGTLRHAFVIGDGPVSVEAFSLLRGEWEEQGSGLHEQV